MKQCNYPNCTGKLHGRANKCPAHQQQWRLYRKLTPVRDIHTGCSRISRIADRYTVNTSSNCWEWTGFRNKANYGRLTFRGEGVLAHRFAYETLVGTIPSGGIVCHHCDNPPCINPAHLFVGSDKTNAADKVAKKRHPRNIATSCKHGHEYTIESCYYTVHKATGRRYRRCRICDQASNQRRK